MHILKLSFLWVRIICLLLMASPLHAQQPSRHFRERVFLHCDKQSYLAGEILWFKAYVTDAGTAKPSGLSKVCYVEVSDVLNKSVLQAKIALNDGSGAGSLYLPVSLNTGNYTVSAYTNWMKNDGPASFFESGISVINTLKNATGLGDPDSMKAVVDFYPEGGLMLEAVPNNIAFRLHSENGKGLDGVLRITDGTDTTEATPTGHFGLGHFLLNPVAGKRYVALVFLADGRRFTAALPAPDAPGMALSANLTTNGLQVSVRSNLPGSPAAAYLVVHHGGVVTFTQTANITATSSAASSSTAPGAASATPTWVVDPATLAPGINYLTLFNAARQPISERLVFIRPVIDSTIRASTDKSIYADRDRVMVAVRSLLPDTMSMMDLSVSVYREDSIDAATAAVPAMSILEDHWLGELQGEVEQPGYLLSAEPDAARVADDVMLTAGWRTFTKQPGISEARASGTQRLSPEVRGQLIIARVWSMPENLPAPGVPCYLSIQSQPFIFLVGVSDTAGYVRFDVKDFYGPGDMVVQAKPVPNRSFRVDVLTPFAAEPHITPRPFFTINQTFENDLLQRSIAMQASNVYAPDSMSRTGSPLIDTLPFYGKAELIYYLDDYKRFTTMEEVLREYVTNVGVAARGGSLHVNVFDETRVQTYPTEDVLVLIDGVPLADGNRIFSIDPLKVRRIDVVPRVYLYQTASFRGIISVQKYAGAPPLLDLDPGTVALDYEGLQLQRVFYSPNHGAGGNARKRAPDMRTTLQWVPFLKLGAKAGDQEVFHFFTSDIRGSFRVVVQGLSSTGHICYAETGFTVK